MKQGSRTWRVNETGVPNEVGALIPLKTRLNVQKWKEVMHGHPDEAIVISGVQFGFSLQYVGPPLSEVSIEIQVRRG